MSFTIHITPDKIIITSGPIIHVQSLCWSLLNHPESLYSWCQTFPTRVGSAKWWRNASFGWKKTWFHGFTQANPGKLNYIQSYQHLSTQGASFLLRIVFWWTLVFFFVFPTGLFLQALGGLARTESQPAWDAKLLKMTIEIVDFPMKNGDVPYTVVMETFTRGYLGNRWK